LEVTLALAVLAVAFTSLSALQTRNLSLTAENQTLTRATLAARDLLAQLQSGSLPMEDDEDDLGEDYPGWRWQLRTEDTPLDELQRVELTIFHEDGKPEDGITFWFFTRGQET
jgi:Tfp pilus assembly protein PilV